MKLRDRNKNESGSALLVVLGFLSFMVVSAVAFAIYMRAERVPSSALRRNVATRHLVKAAMAQAMSRVDDAIRNDPFPGLANTNENVFARFYHDKDNNSMDLWLGRVFMPPDPAGLLDDGGSKVTGANDPGDLNKFAWRFAPVTETVSVLNLEALGYLPPALVNDVRFLSRSSFAAKWQNFSFDAGRFAFCAVNVSDYFDINRTSVGVRSSPLDSRISLRGTLTWRPENNQEETVTEGSFTSISQMLGPDAVRQTYSNPDGNAGSAANATTEYVSMLDYNLAFGSKFPSGVGPIYSPFYNWIRKGSENYFYGGTIKTAQGAMQARRQPFVTDSYATNDTFEVADFAKLEGQPFKDVDMKDSKRLTLRDVVPNNSDRFLKQMYDKGLLGIADIPLFYDYLDHDDVPLSLAMPSVECVPMVTAVELVGNNLAKLKVTPGTPISDPSSVTKFTGTQTKKTPYKLDPSSFISDAAAVRVLVAFPFRHFRGRNIDGFKVQVAMKVFVAAGAVSVRPADGLADLHPSKEEWDSSSTKGFSADGKESGDALVWTLYSEKADISIPNENKTQEDALMQIDVTRWSGSAVVPGDQDFFTVITKQEFVNGVPSGTPQPFYQLNLRPFKDGQLLPGGEQAGSVSAAAFGGDQFRTHAMLWVRVTDSSGKETYDLAPAVVADDKLNDNKNNEDVYAEFFGAVDSSACLLFSADQAKSFTYANLEVGNLAGLQGEDRDWQPKAVATVDPRYNYAPEDWFALNQSISKGAWLDMICNAGYFNVSENRDPDIFMFASNQGYLQSFGEIGFLPRLSEWRERPTGRISTILAMAPGKNAAATYASDPQSIMNKACAWRTYPIDRNFYEDCAEIGLGRNSDDVQTVNPYSDDETVLLSVFANTPCDYWTAGRIVAGAGSRNETLAGDFLKIVNKMGDKSKTSGEDIGKASECLKYSFCEKNDDSSSRMKPEEVKAIMHMFADALRAEGASKPWEEIYDSLPWFDSLDPQDDNSFKKFFGQTLNNCPLYSIDRKFLYSYWRDCFANKQQLFLIFVRAESTALGGPGEGTPSQQGGRAVALVWREPTAYNGGSNPGNTYSDNIGQNDIRSQEFRVGRRPHRMRVLFYHQFD
ncbi:MAG: hypothetical protein IJ658_00960 [Kiritimatiellae bacterium]|nr:hypothetical protein [Kiritimatiellia bacterium]